MVKGVEMQLLLDFQLLVDEMRSETSPGCGDGLTQVQFPVQGVYSVRFSDFGVHGRE